MNAPQLYLVTDRHATQGRSVPDVLEEAFKGIPTEGPRPRVAVQLRDKDLSGAALFSLAVQLRELTQRFGVPLFINGRLDVAMACGADGIHLGEGALPIAVVRRLCSRLCIGVSTHSLADVVRAQAEGADFAVFGPLFDTPSKHGLLEPRGLEALRAACSQGLPVLALGGVDPQAVPVCLASGAVGVAVIRAVHSASEPKVALRALLAGFGDPK